METSTIFSRFVLKEKRVFVIMMFFLFYLGNAQTSVLVNYKSSVSFFPNPERGFYKHHEVHSTSYSDLNQNTLNGYRDNNITLILRLFYLESFINGPISSSYLSNMQSDFNKIRSAGLKCIVRFAYSDNTNGTLDATKNQVLAHIEQLKPFLSNNSDIIVAVQAGFIGAWGEWYYTSNFGQNPSASDFANRKEVVDALLAAIPNKMIQIRTPSLKQKTYSRSSAITADQAFDGTDISRLGHHNDCFLASSSDFGTYTNTGTEYPYLSQETLYTPMGGETCAVNEPRSKCTTAIAEMERFHWSYMNLDYNASVINGFRAETCFAELQNRLGYRFELVSGSFPQSGSVGGQIPITLKIINSGFAALFNQRTVYLILRNSLSNKEYSFALKADPRYWNGAIMQTITENITFPSDMIAGDYKLYLFLPDSDLALKVRPEYSIRMANDNLWETSTGYNNLLFTMNVKSSLGINDVDANKRIVIYSVPGQYKLIAESDVIKDYSVSVFNVLGQKIDVDYSLNENRITFETQTLSNGLYFFQFQINDKREVRKIFISH